MATEWIRRLFGLDHAGVDAALAVSPPGARGLTFLPHLGGERTPNAPSGAGVFSGIRAEHTLEDLVRAVVEGVTFGFIREGGTKTSPRPSAPTPDASTGIASS